MTIRVTMIVVIVEGVRGTPTELSSGKSRDASTRSAEDDFCCGRGLMGVKRPDVRPSMLALTARPGAPRCRGRLALRTERRMTCAGC